MTTSIFSSTESDLAQARLKAALDLASEGAIAHLRAGGTMGEVAGVERDELEALYSLGYSLYEQAQYSDAFKAFSVLVAYDHLDLRYAGGLAGAAKEIGRYEDALRQYMFLALASPMEPAPLYHSAECLLRLQKQDEAVEALDLVIQLCEENAQYAAIKERAEGLRNLVMRVS